MLGIGKRIEKLGDKLGEAFYHRAVQYFQKSKSSDGTTKNNFQLVGTILAEISEIIIGVTRKESEES